MFEIGRDKLGQEIDIVSFLKRFQTVRGAIKSAYTEEDRKRFHREGRYNVIFLNDKEKFTTDASEYMSAISANQ